MLAPRRPPEGDGPDYSRGPRPMGKPDWPRGEWDTEPDLVRWIDPSGLRCMAKRHRDHGNWCGYVRIPRGHPWHGVDYAQRGIGMNVQAHGGLTWAGRLRRERGWWIGFDCAHAWDYSPGLVALTAWAMGEEPRLPCTDRNGLPEVYRNLPYVRIEIEVMCVQTMAAATTKPFAGPARQAAVRYRRMRRKLRREWMDDYRKRRAKR